MKHVINSRQSDQKGMVSIIVTMVLMVVMSLIVLGFAQISRREQRDALDTQLSTEAFYAAESGVNDAVSALTSGTPYVGYKPSVAGEPDDSLGTGDTNKTHCSPDQAGSPAPALLNNMVDTTTNTSYTCLLINETPTSLVYSPVTQNNAISADVHFLDSSNNAASADQMTITWQAPSPLLPATFPGAFPKLPTVSNWTGQTALARLEMTNFSANGPTGYNDYSRDNLNGSTFTAFLYPSTNNANSIAFDESPAGQGAIVPGDCATATGICSVTITGVASPHVFLRLGALYAPETQFVITAENALGQPLKMTGGQAVIDSTGKSQDVLRRIQVRLSLGPTGTPMTYAVQAIDGICKNMQISPGFASANTCVAP